MTIYKGSKAIVLTDELRAYLLAKGVKEPPILRDLRLHTENMPEKDMQILPEQGQLMGMLLKVLNPKNILEIGTYTGYSALCMALAAPNARIVCLDKNVEWTNIAQKYWSIAGVSHRIKLVLGDAAKSLKTLPLKFFDCIFVDAKKKDYPIYITEGLERLSPRGIIILDNVLWNGRVIDKNFNDVNTQTIRDLNDRLVNDDGLDISMVPIGDGITIIRRKND